jgi:hypothetical protein
VGTWRYHRGVCLDEINEKIIGIVSGSRLKPDTFRIQPKPKDYRCVHIIFMGVPCSNSGQNGYRYKGIKHYDITKSEHKPSV